jgi:hypothetical protein
VDAVCVVMWLCMRERRAQTHTHTHTQIHTLKASVTSPGTGKQSQGTCTTKSPISQTMLALSLPLNLMPCPMKAGERPLTCCR